MTRPLFKFTITSLLAAAAVVSLPSLGHAQSKAAPAVSQGPRCVPGQQIACACAAGGGSGVQRCSSDGANFGACQGCAAPAASSPADCDLVGTWQLALSWQAAKCTYALDKTSFVVTRSQQGYTVEDKSSGVTDKVTIKVEKTTGGCAIELMQSIDPEGAIAGTKTVSGDKYTYWLTTSNGAITGTGKYQNFQFNEKPACVGTFRVTGVRGPKGSR